MNLQAAVGWALALAAIAIGWAQWGWPGVALAATMTVLWLLLQWSRALRVLQRAGAQPVGQVANAVMLHARLQRGQTLPQILAHTGSLGRQVADDPAAGGGPLPGRPHALGGREGTETFEWHDAGGDAVRIELRGGRRAAAALDAAARAGSRDARHRHALTRGAPQRGRARATAPHRTAALESTPTLDPGIPMSMSDRDGKIWFDGKLVEWRDAKIHVLSHTLHYGCGAFEGVRAYNTASGTAVFRLREHTERLFNSAKILRMKIPFSFEQVCAAQLEVVRANKLESCYLRPLVWIGDEKLGVNPRGNTIHLMVAAWSWGAYLGEEGMKKGIRVKTSSYTRHHVNITMTQAKAVSNYTNSILANLEATEDGYDEAMLLDSAGFVSEGAGENLFVIKAGVVYTPDLSAGALNGITRNTVFAICADLGLKIVEKRITRDEVYIADEAFFTGTAAEVTPIREYDRIAIGAGERGPLTTKIQAAFFDIVNGRNAKYAEWLTAV